MDTALVQRFRDELERLIGPEPQRLGLAVSGGPDSLALLLLGREAFGAQVAAATVDHGLRPESADEARHVAAICADGGVHHATLTLPEPITGNLQAGAREARYALLEDWRARHGLDWIATAHHADDQLETIVMRLLRGSGVAGLSGIRQVNGKVIRPLLGFRKSELRAIVDASRHAAIDDPSNHDTRFDRTRIRAALSGLDIRPQRLARTTEALREASELVEWAIERAAERVIVEQDGVVTLVPDRYPREMRRRLVLRCLALVDPARAPRGPALDRLLETMASGGRASMGSVLCSGGQRWTFRPAPQRKAGRRTSRSST